MNRICSRASMGVGGQAGLARAMAMLQTLRLGSPDSGTAVTQFQEMMSQMYGSMAQHSFQGRGRNISPEVQKLLRRNLPGGATGVDLDKMLLDASRHGIDPLTAYLGKLLQITKGFNPTELNLALGNLIHNETARKGFVTWIQNQGFNRDLEADLSHVDSSRVGRDLVTAQADGAQELDKLTENYKQLDRRFGRGLLPEVTSINKRLDEFNGWVERTDRSSPGLINNVLGLTGGFLGLVAAVGLLKFVGPALGGAFSLVFQPLRLLSRGLAAGVLGLQAFAASALAFTGIGALLGAAAYDIIDNWAEFGPLFERAASGDLSAVLGPGGILPKLFGDFAVWADGWTGGFATQLGHWMGDAFDAVGPIVSQSIEGWKKLLADLNTDIHGVAEAITIPTPVGQRERRLATGRDPNGRDDLGLPGLDDLQLGPPRRDNAAPRPPPPPQQVEVRLHVSADRGLNVTTLSAGPNTVVRLPPDRGLFLGRP